jgi:hypothetical protein
MKVMLVFPPNWTPTMPHLALPTLTAYLRANGVEVIQRDLNAEVFDEVLTRRYIDQAVAHLRHDYGPNAKKRPIRRAYPNRERVLWALQHGPQLAEKVQAAKRTIHSERFYDGAASLDAFQVMIQSLEIASLPYYPASLHLQSYSAGYAVDSSRSLLQGVADPNTNMFLDIYRRGILADIEREQPDIVGISIPSMPQMMAGMTLAYLIKEAGLNCHVTVGGRISVWYAMSCRACRRFSR